MPYLVLEIVPAACQVSFMRVEAGETLAYKISPTISMAYKLVDSEPKHLSCGTAFRGVQHAQLRDSSYLQLVFRYRYVPIGQVTKVQKPGTQQSCHMSDHVSARVE
jgi:hypothetical protein